MQSRKIQYRPKKWELHGKRDNARTRWNLSLTFFVVTCKKKAPRNMCSSSFSTPIFKSYCYLKLDRGWQDSSAGNGTGCQV